MPAANKVLRQVPCTGTPPGIGVRCHAPTQRRQVPCTDGINCDVPGATHRRLSHRQTNKFICASPPGTAASRFDGVFVVRIRTVTPSAGDTIVTAGSVDTNHRDWHRSSYRFGKSCRIRQSAVDTRHRVGRSAQYLRPHQGFSGRNWRHMAAGFCEAECRAAARS
jgi:hypothetical protein